MNNPKVNYTQEDEETYIQNVFLKMIIEKEHPKLIKRARKLAKKYLKEHK
jgi:hypothetical protein